MFPSDSHDRRHCAIYNSTNFAIFPIRTSSFNLLFCHRIETESNPILSIPKIVYVFTQTELNSLSRIERNMGHDFMLSKNYKKYCAARRTLSFRGRVRI